MSILLELEYGGQILGSIPVTLTPEGSSVKCVISGDGSESAQIAHTWKNLLLGGVDRKVGTVISVADQDLKIILRAEEAEDVTKLNFISLRTAVVEWLYLESGVGGEPRSYVSFSVLEIPSTSALIGFAELETPASLRSAISFAVFEVTESSSFISHAVLEIADSNALISHAALEVPEVTGGPPPSGTDFFFADFEENNWSEWTWNPDIFSTGRDSIVADGSDYGGGSSVRSAQTIYPAGITDGGGSGWSNSNLAVLPDHFLAEYDFKLSTPFHFPHGQKMWRVLTDGNSGFGPNDTYANHQLNDHGGSFQMHVISSSPTFGSLEFVINGGLPSPPTTGVWHRIGYRYKKNTFTGATPNFDGEMELFYDGVSIGSRSDARLTADPSRWLRDYWGGPGNYTSFVDSNPIPVEQWIRVDNFRITAL